ncbi:hypothetical protein [Sulfurovum sp.]|uniref:hypothetical protein n=1 Tax=Sulfurovum sp. TaxID=1969726 RepID=UPI003561E6DF
MAYVKLGSSGEILSGYTRNKCDHFPDFIHDEDARFIEYCDSLLPVAQCTMRQARLALSYAGVLQQIDEYINLMAGPEGDAARIEWNYGTTVIRTHPLVLTVLPEFGLTEEDIDNLFISAITY